MLNTKEELNSYIITFTSGAVMTLYLQTPKRLLEVLDIHQDYPDTEDKYRTVIYKHHYDEVYTCYASRWCGDYILDCLENVFDQQIPYTIKTVRAIIDNFEFDGVIQTTNTLEWDSSFV